MRKFDGRGSAEDSCTKRAGRFRERAVYKIGRGLYVRIFAEERSGRRG